VALPENAYNNGTLTVAGHVFNVHKNQINVVEVKHSNVTLNFTGLHDDDDDAVLPYDIAANSAAIEALLNSKYGAAYIAATIDGGGSPANNKLTVPFRLNVDTTSSAAMIKVLKSANALESDGARANDFWVAYVLMAFQGHPYDPDTAPTDPRGDNDDNAEVALGGVVPFLNAIGGFVFVEELRDEQVELGINSLIPTIGHEIAHEFGLEDCNSCPGDFMGPDYYLPTSRFSAADIDRLRARNKSPGRVE